MVVNNETCTGPKIFNFLLNLMKFLLLKDLKDEMGVILFQFWEEGY